MEVTDRDMYIGVKIALMATGAYFFLVAAVGITNGLSYPEYLAPIGAGAIVGHLVHDELHKRKLMF